MKKRLVLSPVLSLSILLPTSGQTNTPPGAGAAGRDQEDVVRITSNLVQVDVTVTDSRGRQVTDLRPEDFEIIEEGKPQRITNFSYISRARKPAASAPAPPPLPTGVGDRGAGKRPPVPAPVPPARLRPEQVRNSIALVVDDLGLSQESSVRVRQALKKFVDEQMQPGDLVAVIRTSAGMGALQQFTADKRLLYAAIERVRYNLGSRSAVSTFAPVGGEGIAVQIKNDALAMHTGGPQQKTGDQRAGVSHTSAPGAGLNSFREEIFSVGTLGALNFVLRGLKELPGRKSLILFSDGFKMYPEDPGSTRVLDSLRRLTDLANRASVVFYTIDPRGVQYTGISAADNLSGPMGTTSRSANTEPGLSGLSQQTIDRLGGEEKAAAHLRSREPRPTNPFYTHMDDINQAITERRRDFFESQQGLSYLATQTGGFLVKNNNDIVGAVHRVLNDQEGYYLIGYRPDDSLTRPEGERPYRNLVVRVRRPDLQVRTRKGYYGFTSEEASNPFRTPTEQLFAALTSPFQGGQIGLRMTSLFGYDAQRGPFTQSLLHINAKDLGFRATPQGWREAVLEIMAVTFGDSGKVIDQDDRSYHIQVSEKEFERAERDGLVYVVTLPIKKPGAYQLRIGVRDQATSKVGSANQYIEVPDVKKGRLALSGVTLRGVAGAPEAGPVVPASQIRPAAADLSDPTSGPASRRMRRGMTLHYGYFIYNARADKATGQPQLSTQVRLFREGSLVYEGQLRDFRPDAQQAGAKQFVAGGSLRLGAELAPGDYVLQVVVLDRLARKADQQLATQWMDFEIVE